MGSIPAGDVRSTARPAYAESEPEIRASENRSENKFADFTGVQCCLLKSVFVMRNS